MNLAKIRQLGKQESNKEQRWVYLYTKGFILFGKSKHTYLLVKEGNIPPNYKSEQFESIEKQNKENPIPEIILL